MPQFPNKGTTRQLSPKDASDGQGDDGGGVRQFAVWGDTDEGRHILIGVARYLAAHSPTERAALQTADIARRLMRGGELHQSAESA